MASKPRKTTASADTSTPSASIPPPLSEPDEPTQPPATPAGPVPAAADEPTSSTSDPDTSDVTPDVPVDGRAAALAQLAASSDVAYSDEPLTLAEQTAAAEAGITTAGDVDPAAVRKATAEAGTGTPDESVRRPDDAPAAGDYDPDADPAPADSERTAPELAPVSRDTALEALLGGIVTSDTNTVTLTGDVVDLGGDLERLVIVSRYNAMVKGGRNEYGPVEPYAMGARAGDVVLVTEAEAKRGEELGALVELPSDVDPDEAGAEVEVLDPEDTTALTDEALAELNAKDLLDYVSRHPDQAERVVAAEQQRPASKQRATILALTDTSK